MMIHNRPWLLKKDYLNAIAVKEMDFFHADFQAESFLERQAAKYKARIEGNTAIIPITGMITAKYTWWTWLFDGTACDHIRREFSAAMGDDMINHVVLEIDSPGGEVDGIQPLSDFIYEGRQAGKKPVTTFVNSMMCSAATWLGTAASEIVLSSKTDITGSIGVVTIHQSIEQLEKKIGIETTEIYEGKYKRIASPYKALSAEGRETLQKQVKYLYDMFVGTVARNRGVSREAAEGMADGKIFIGEQALEVGLADRLGSLSSIISQPGRSVAFSAVTEAKKTMPETQQTPVPEITVTVDYLAANYPNLLADIRAKAFEDGKKDGINAERERVKGIKSLMIEGYEDVTEKAIEDGNTPEQASMALCKAVKDRGITINALRNESQFAGAATVSNPEKEAGGMSLDERRKEAQALADRANAMAKEGRA